MIGCVLFELGFSLTRKRDYISATRKTNFGRIHVLFKEKDKGKVFCEIHVDAMLHFLRFGVDYDSKPSTFFESELKEKLDQTGIRWRMLNGRSWSTRENKALITGLRL